MNIYNIPQNEQKMDEIYVVLSSDQNGEGIISMQGPLGQMPLVFGHERMLNHVKDMVKQMAKDTGKTIRIFKFKKSEMLEEISGAH